MFFAGLGLYFHFLNSDWSSGDYDYPSQTRFEPKSANPVIVEEISRNENCSSFSKSFRWDLVFVVYNSHLKAIHCEIRSVINTHIKPQLQQWIQFMCMEVGKHVMRSLQMK